MGGRLKMLEKCKHRALYLENEIVKIKNIIETLPDGNIIVCNNATNYGCYVSYGSEREYIPKKNSNQIYDLALKKFYSCQLKDYKNELKAINSFINYEKNHPFDSAKKLISSPGYKNIFQNNFFTSEEKLAKWLTEEVALAPYQEKRIFKTMSGEMVRSKSEVLILDRLYIKGIPFRYEYPLEIWGSLFFPDITIPLFNENKFIYWEHFGMMSDRAYVDRATNKIASYSNAGILPNVDLIMTFENNNNPLDPERIDYIIDYYFVN